MTTLRHTGYMTATHLLQLWRQPWWIAVTLVQPVIWLLLFGSLFEVPTCRASAATPTSTTSHPGSS